MYGCPDLLNLVAFWFLLTNVLFVQDPDQVLTGEGSATGTVDPNLGV